MSGPELLPCPFCGGEAKRYTIGEDEPANTGGDVINCTKCGASSHVEFGYKENLVSHWNTRLASNRIQSIIDTYRTAGANLLNWLSDEDGERAPRHRRYLFGLIRLKPSSREWREWASDVACRTAFETLREARARIDARKDGVS